MCQKEEGKFFLGAGAGGHHQSCVSGKFIMGYIQSGHENLESTGKSQEGAGLGVGARQVRVGSGCRSSFTNRGAGRSRDLGILCLFCSLALGIEPRSAGLPSSPYFNSETGSC